MRQIEPPHAHSTSTTRPIVPNAARSEDSATMADSHCDRDETHAADNQTTDMSADQSTAEGAGDSGASVVEAVAVTPTESSAEGVAVAANSHKRKPDKAARRAASKAAKKAKRAEYVRNSVEQGAEPDDAEQTEETNAEGEGRADHGTVRRQGCVSDESVRETDYYFANGQWLTTNPRDTRPQYADALSTPCKHFSSSRLC
jgi:hypothetical protein